MSQGWLFPAFKTANLYTCLPEIDQESDRKPAHASLRDRLCHMDVLYLACHGLQLNQDLVFHNQIHTMDTERSTFVLNYELLFALSPESHQCELVAQSVSVEPLFETWTRDVVHFVTSRDDLFRQIGVLLKTARHMRLSEATRVLCTDIVASSSLSMNPPIP